MNKTDDDSIYTKIRTDTEDIEKIQGLIDKNELQDLESFNSIASVEWSHKNTDTKSKWYQNYTVPGGFVQGQEPRPPEHHKLGSLEVGHEVSAIEAITRRELGDMDIRPRIFDKLSKTWILLDSGSCVSCSPKQPNDIPDPSFKLKAVNGNAITTYGTRNIHLQIGRKRYSIQAVIADIPQTIFGWDIFKKYSLGLEWNQWGDLLLTDNKAKISSLLKHVVVDQSIPQIERISVIEMEQNLFEMECMRKISAISIEEDQESPFFIDNLPLPNSLDPESNKNDKVNEEALKKLDKKWSDVVSQYDILKTTFHTKPKHNIKHVIDTGEAAPIKSKVRPLLATSEKSKKGKEIWEEMQKMGVIERVNPSKLTQWASPLHLAKKPHTNSWRPCVDFRLINNVTKADCYPIPTLKNFTKHLKGSKIFSVIDLRSAYFNLPIHENSIDKTTVLSPWGGAFVFKRLFFGLKNGPASWMKFLDSCLSGIDGIYTYLDDILVSSDSEENHIKILHTLFGRLQKFGLCLALDKCVFGQPEVDYLGYRVSPSGIKPQSHKVQAVNKIPSPSTQKHLLQFLGALNYFRSSLRGLKKNGRFQNAANLLQPLYSAATISITNKNRFKEIWDNSPILKEAFEDAKTMLVNATELAHLDPNLPLALFTDSSDHSIGGVLMQQQGQKYVPLGYFSKHLSVDKANWAVYRKELLAAQASLRYFISDIYGKHCTIWTDHLPLVNAYKGSGFQLHDPVAQRALMEISQFTKDIRHVSGVHNVAGDYFSRLPPPEKLGSVYQPDSLKQPSTNVAVIEGLKLQALDPKVIAEAQEECKDIAELKNHPSKWTEMQFGMTEIGGTDLFCELSNTTPRPYLPVALRKFVMEQLHNSLEHAGQKESKRRVSAYYYWKGMRGDIESFVRTCHGCQSVTPTKAKPPHIGDFDVPDRRFSHIHLDIVGPLPPSKGHKFLLTIKDRSTRFLQAIPLVTPTSEAIADSFMLHWAAIFGLPSVCTSDQGSNLTSGLFRGLQDNLGIKVNYSPIYFPQANGMIERSHQTIKNSIKAKLIEMGDKYQDQWINYLPWVLLGIRSAFNQQLGTSSAEMTLGFHPQLPGTVLADPGNDLDLEDGHLKTILRKLQIKDNRPAVPTTLNTANPKVPSLPDDVSHVYVRRHDTKGLASKYVGPFPVTSRPQRSTLK